MHDKVSGSSLPKASLLSAFAGAIVLALVHQYLFFGHGLGVSMPIFVIVFYVYMYSFNRDRCQPITWIGRLLFVVIMMLALTYVLFDNPIFYVLNALAISALISVHMVLLFGEKGMAGQKSVLSVRR